MISIKPLDKDLSKIVAESADARKTERIIEQSVEVLGKYGTLRRLGMVLAMCEYCRGNGDYNRQ